MIIKIPHDYILQHNKESFREYYVNINAISFIEVSKWIYMIAEKPVEQYQVMITMTSGPAPAIKNLTLFEFQEFILWWNKNVSLEKLSYDKFIGGVV